MFKCYSSALVSAFIISYVKAYIWSCPVIHSEGRGPWLSQWFHLKESRNDAWTGKAFLIQQINQPCFRTKFSILVHFILILKKSVFFFFWLASLKSLVRFWSSYKSMQNHVMLLDSSATKNIFWRVSRTFGASSGSFDALTKLSGPPSSTRGSIPFFIPRLHSTSKRKREEEAMHWGLNRNNITPRCDAFEILHVVPRRFLHYESP